LNERQSLEQELAELRGQIAAHRNELVIMVVNLARRDRLEWQIRERARRLVDVRARLAVIGPSLHDPSAAGRPPPGGRAAPSLAKSARERKLDAMVRRALGLVLRRRRRSNG
jgi:hypothetical protein